MLTAELLSAPKKPTSVNEPEREFFIVKNVNVKYLRCSGHLCRRDTITFDLKKDVKSPSVSSKRSVNALLISGQAFLTHGRSVFEHFTKVAIKEAVRASAQVGLQTAAAAAGVGALQGIYNGITKEYSVHIDVVQIVEFNEQAVRTILEAFLAWQAFIDPNDAADLTDVIGQQIIANPVRAPCNHYFEAHSIHQWVEGHHNCPIDRKPIDVDQLHFSWALQIKLAKFAERVIKSLDVERPNPAPVPDLLLPPALQNQNHQALRHTMEGLAGHVNRQLTVIFNTMEDALSRLHAEGELTQNQYGTNIAALYIWKIA